MGAALSCTLRSRRARAQPPATRRRRFPCAPNGDETERYPLRPRYSAKPGTKRFVSGTCESAQSVFHAESVSAP